MAYKLNLLINMTMDFDNIVQQGKTPPWFDVKSLDLEPIAIFLQNHIRSGDKIEIVIADDYLDFVSMQMLVDNGLAEQALTFMSELMDDSRKLSKRQVLAVSEGWRKHPVIAMQDIESSPPPFAIFIQVRGSTEDTVLFWYSQLSGYMGVLPMERLLNNKAESSHSLFKGLSDKLEEVFGVPFISDSGLGTISR